MNKICKQCGKTQPLDAFRKYTPRGKKNKEGKYERNTTQGYNTTCKQCEKINAQLTLLWKKTERTAEEELALEEGATYYKALVDKGLHPLGTYFKHVMGIEDPPRPSAVQSLLDSMEEVSAEATSLMHEFERLLEMEFTESPDVYEEMQNALMEQGKGPDGGVVPMYREINSKITEKWSAYEDQYEW